LSTELVTALSGLAASFLSGLLGIGGGIVLTPLLLYLPGVFGTADLQLTKIESRPSRAAAWDYVFYLDFEGDPAVSPAREAVARMRESCEWIQVLGTYPAAGAVLDPDAVGSPHAR